jgi:hypothetical protein
MTVPWFSINYLISDLANSLQFSLSGAPEDGNISLVIRTFFSTGNYEFCEVVLLNHDEVFLPVSFSLRVNQKSFPHTINISLQAGSETNTRSLFAHLSYLL